MQFIAGVQYKIESMKYPTYIEGIALDSTQLITADGFIANFKSENSVRITKLNPENPKLNELYKNRDTIIKRQAQLEHNLRMQRNAQNYLY